jgi:hypothetical protein
MFPQKGAASLLQSMGSESQQTSQWLITLTAELTEELELLRREIKVELKNKDTKHLIMVFRKPPHNRRVAGFRRASMPPGLLFSTKETP